MTTLKKDTPLKPKMKKYTRRLAQTGEIIQAANDVGYKGNYGSQLMRNPKIQTALQEELDALGVSKTVVVRKLKQGLIAYRVIKDGGKKYKDFHAIHKYLDMYMKLEGHYAPEKHEIRQEKLVVILSPELRKGLIDSEAITEKEAKIIEAEVLDEEKDARR